MERNAMDGRTAPGVSVRLPANRSGDQILMASQYCRQPCKSAGCIGVCTRILDPLGGHAGYEHQCASGHTW